MGWAGHIARAKISNVYKMLAGNPEEPTQRWECNIKIYLNKKTCEVS
jgi:hypothetical protein